MFFNFSWKYKFGQILGHWFANDRSQAQNVDSNIYFVGENAKLLPVDVLGLIGKRFLQKFGFLRNDFADQ